MYRILLVESDDKKSRSISHVLEGEYQLELVHSAEEAVDRVEKTKFDLFLVDIQLPEQSGYRLCASLRNHASTKNIPTVLFSGAKHLDFDEFKEKIRAKLGEKMPKAA